MGFLLFFQGTELKGTKQSLGPRGKKKVREESVQFRWHRWKLKVVKQLRKTALGFGGWV